MKKVIVVTGLPAVRCACARHSLKRDTFVVRKHARHSGRNRAGARGHEVCGRHKADLRTVELDVLSDTSANAAIRRIMRRQTVVLDVVVHNAGTYVRPASRRSPGTARNSMSERSEHAARHRAALPSCGSKAGIGGLGTSSSSAGWYPPYLAPYFASEGWDGCSGVVSARELTRWGSRPPSVPVHSQEDNHFAHSGRPADTQRVG